MLLILSKVRAYLDQASKAYQQIWYTNRGGKRTQDKTVQSQQKRNQVKKNTGAKEESSNEDGRELIFENLYAFKNLKHDHCSCRSPVPIISSPR